MSSDENIYGSHLCPYAERTWHGLYAVELMDGLCPMGLGCLPECPHAYGEDRYSEACARLAQSVIEREYPEAAR